MTRRSTPRRAICVAAVRLRSWRCHSGRLASGSRSRSALSASPSSFSLGLPHPESGVVVANLACPSRGRRGPTGQIGPNAACCACFQPGPNAPLILSTWGRAVVRAFRTGAHAGPVAAAHGRPTAAVARERPAAAAHGRPAPLAKARERLAAAVTHERPALLAKARGPPAAVAAHERPAGAAARGRRELAVVHERLAVEAVHGRPQPPAAVTHERPAVEARSAEPPGLRKAD